MNERNVIQAFVSHLGKMNGYSMLMVDRWPEDDNCQTPEIDAIAGPYAIEHTTIDTVADQRRRDDWYRQVVGGLDQVISDCVDCGFTITLEYDAIEKGMDWNCIRADLRNWILGNAFNLSHGSHQITLPTSTSVASPIVMRVWKGQSRRIGFARFEPEDDTLATRAKRLLDRKAKKLLNYQIPYATTILLIENDDIALMNEMKLLEAIREAYPEGLPQGVDEIWFVDTSIPHKLLFCDWTAVIGHDSVAARRLRHHPGAAQEPAQRAKPARASADGVQGPV